jgi:hypothetical protein
MDFKLSAKTEEFTRFCGELKARMGTIAPTLQRVIDHEVARVVEKALEKTDAADRQKIRERVKNRAKFEIEGQTYITNYRGKAQHVPDRIWAIIEHKRRRMLLRKLAKVGLTKRSWLILARKLGEEIKAPAYVRQAKSEFLDGEVQNNVSVRRQGGGNRYGLRIDNRTPILRWTNGTQAWYGALEGRIRFYHRNVAAGVFDHAHTIGKKYKVVVKGPTVAA